MPDKLNEATYIKYLTRIMAGFFSLPLGVVLLAICYGPSSDNLETTLFLLKWAPLFLLIEFPLSYFVFMKLLEQKNFLLFILMLVIVESLLTMISIYLGITFNRDFFTATFQYLMCLPVILLYHLWTQSYSEMQKKNLLTASRAGLILSIFYAEWIMFMGYAITTRAEPRPIEAMIYNAYNLLLTLVLYVSANRIGQRTILSVHISENSMRIHSKDVTSVFGPKKMTLLFEFVKAPERKLRCADIQFIQNTSEIQNEENCIQCLQNETKATLCTKYRSTYNAILDIKKILEFLEIGTITSSTNKRNILTDGWKLVLFENVKFHVIK